MRGRVGNQRLAGWGGERGGKIRGRRDEKGERIYTMCHSSVPWVNNPSVPALRGTRAGHTSLASYFWCPVTLLWISHHSHTASGCCCVFQAQATFNSSFPTKSHVRVGDRLLPMLC